MCVEEREDGAGGERERDRRVRRPAPHLERRGPGQRRGGTVMARDGSGKGIGRGAKTAWAARPKVGRGLAARSV
jgi:hypothetical protein